MLTILAMGQSNCVGGQLGGVWAMPSSVTAWNCAADSDSATVGLGTAWTAATQNSAPFYNNVNGLGNSWPAQAARYLAKETGDSVRLLVVARSGYSISNWLGAGSMYARMKAVLAAAGVSAIDGLLWHQGEADIANYATYPTAFNTLLSQLQTDGYITSSTPVVVGEIAAQNTQMNTMLRGLANGRIRVARTGSLPMVASNNLHFTGVGLVRAGIEYARQFIGTSTEQYVTAAGSTQYQVPNSYVPTVIEVGAECGDVGSIQNGGWVCPASGIYEFQASAYAGTGLYGVDLLNEIGDVIQYLTSADSGGAQHYDGSAVLGCMKGDKFYLGVHQVSGVNGPVVDAVQSARFNRLTVKYLGH